MDRSPDTQCWASPQDAQPSSRACPSLGGGPWQGQGRADLFPPKQPEVKECLLAEAWGESTTLDSFGRGMQISES